MRLGAFSSVGRASPLQGEGQKFESSNAHHKSQNDSCYSGFYIWMIMKDENLPDGVRSSLSASELRLERFAL